MSQHGTTVDGVLPDPADIGTFAEVVRGARKQLNLSQNDLAALVCQASRPTVTGNDIARYERGKRIARQEIRRALEEVLGLPVFVLDIAAANQRAERKGATVAATIGVPSLVGAPSAIDRIRAALLDSSGLAALDDEEPPDLDALDRELDQVMTAYQSGRFDQMLGRAARCGDHRPSCRLLLPRPQSPPSQDRRWPYPVKRPPWCSRSSENTTWPGSPRSEASTPPKTPTIPPSSDRSTGRWFTPSSHTAGPMPQPGSPSEPPMTSDQPSTRVRP